MKTSREVLIESTKWWDERYDPVKRFGYDRWEVVITTARYGGVYEGGNWLSFGQRELPDGWDDSDTPCRRFWESEEAAKVGRGSTPNEAYDDMCARIDILKAHEKALQPVMKSWNPLYGSSGYLTDPATYTLPVEYDIKVK